MSVKRKVVIVLASAALLLFVLVLWYVLGGHRVIPNGSEDFYTNESWPGKPAGERIANSPLASDVVRVGEEEIEYELGQFGGVIVDELSESSFSSKEAYREYLENWHDKDWKGEVPPSGRYIYAHYEDKEEMEWVAGEMLVVFEYEVDDEAIKEIGRVCGADVLSIDSHGETQDYKIARFVWSDSGLDPLQCAKTIQGTSDLVVEALPNLVGELEMSAIDPKLTEQDYIALSRFDKAWDVVRCSGSATVAVLDSGIDFIHSDLQDNIDAANAYDAIERECLTRRDSNGHGTQVSGIISAKANNEYDIAGCSYDARIMPIRVADDNGRVSVSDVGEALGHLFDLGNKPDVVNMSFGHSIEGVLQVLVKTEYEIICQGQINELSEQYGIVFVAASGNDGEKGNSRMYPAGLNNVISVASVSNGKTHSTSSCSNDMVDICAQGENVWSTFTGGASGPSSGTSFAAPQVSAAAALLSVQHPDWDPMQIEEQLESTAKDLGDAGRDDLYGHGLLDAAAAVGWTAPVGPPSPSTGAEDLTDEELARLGMEQWAIQTTDKSGMADALALARSINPEVCAWLYVPGTGVSLPVARREGDDSYYLAHSYRGEDSPLGCAYMEGADSPAFDQPLTVLYGHSFPRNPFMFTGLHAFEDPGFFEAHDEVHVLTEDGLLTFRVVEAALYKGAHLSSFADEGDLAALQRYLGNFSSRSDDFTGYRKPVELDASRDKVLQLSTCTVPATDDARFVVTAVLVEEEER